ncbi:hypothetical protein M413DRAFT_243564 [Hebeloma cylindrosporum]|uniref:Uncharacterized protein n=1 Tax=Hebeloma cylindrosporum TaxID=76867 RepID=A0A0C2XLG1_HEBCY|nr:hypothetical protein M413DRAFT_243564 [Hebeloma cylindrosporum h7]
MSSPQNNKRRSKMKKKVKGFIGKIASLFSSSRASSPSQDLDAPPSDVASNRPSTPLRMDGMSGNVAANPSLAARDPMGTDLAGDASSLVLIDNGNPPSDTLQTTATLTGSAAVSKMDPSAIPDSSAPTNDGAGVGRGPILAVNAATKERLRTAWHGAEWLLKSVQGFLDGTPFKVPIAVVNVLIDLGNAVVDNKDALEELVIRTAERLHIVNTALIKEHEADSKTMLEHFAGCASACSCPIWF